MYSLLQIPDHDRQWGISKRIFKKNIETSSAVGRTVQ